MTSYFLPPKLPAETNFVENIKILFPMEKVILLEKTILRKVSVPNIPNFYNQQFYVF